MDLIQPMGLLFLTCAVVVKCEISPIGSCVKTVTPQLVVVLEEVGYRRADTEVL